MTFENLVFAIWGSVIAVGVITIMAMWMYFVREYKNRKQSSLPKTKKIIPMPECKPAKLTCIRCTHNEWNLYYCPYCGRKLREEDS